MGAEIFRGLFDQVGAGFDTNNVTGADLECSKAPTPIVAAEVENAAAD